MLSNSLEHLLDGRRVSEEGQAHLKSLMWNISVWWLNVIWNPLYKIERNCNQNLILIAEISISFFLLLKSFKIRAKDFLNLIGFGTWIGQGDGIGIGTERGNGLSLD